MKLSRFGLVFCMFFLWAMGVAPAMESSDRFEKVVTRIVQAINAEDYKAMQQDFGKVMLDALPLDKLTSSFRNLIGQTGKIEKLDPPRLIPPNEAVFPAHFKNNVVLDIKVVLDEQDKIIGLLFMPHKELIPVPERHQTALGLPFKGEWFVFWGGDTKELNQHHGVPNQSFGFDFVVTDSTGETHKSDAKGNEDFFAFGQPVVAPADGTVTDVITGVRDNVPGSMNPYSALGNAVIIEHREHEVSVLGHFKQGSICVKPGDNVKRGQVLGLCGNSGNSSEPHIHFHLQNTPIIQDGTGIRCMFDRVTVLRDGKSESRTNYSPVKGDIVKPE